MYKYHVMLKDRIPYHERDSDTKYEEEVLDNPEKMQEYIENVFHIKNAGEEHMVMLCLNGDLKPVSAFEVSHGSVQSTEATPKEIFKMALLGGAEGIILAHNHTTGTSTPSNKDWRVLRDVKKTGKTLGIPLMDFIIFGDTNFSAFKDKIL